MTDLLAAQAAIEDESLNMGVERYRKARAEAETNTRPGKRLLTEAIKPLASAVREWVDLVTGGKPTVHANLGYFLQGVEPDVVAYVTSRIVINSLGGRATLQSAAMQIASTLEDVVNFDAIKAENPRAYKLLQRKIAQSSDPGYRHVVMRRQQKYAGVKAIKWGRREKLQLGILLIDFMEQSFIVNGAPVFEKKLTNSTGKTYDSLYTLAPTVTAMEWLEESHARCEMLEPVNMPMVVPPLAWTTPFDGGYLNPKLRYPLVKTKGRRAYLEELRHFEMPKVYTAVNALQGTAWRVNKAVLKVLRQAWDENVTLAKLPPRDLLPLPPNAPEDCTAEELQAVKAAKARVYSENVRLMSKRMAMNARLWLADKFAPFEAVYFPHALDWRGRAYPVATYLHPQADDTGKALLEFSKGVPLGPNGAYWLAVHGANCYGVDKASFDDRVQWVMDHQEEIIASAIEPLGPRGDFWTKTEEDPWRFLAFCFEWAGFAMSGCSEAYVSHLPVAFDGSCNGLQHYSMMLRDEVGGAATNLIPSASPSDIYSLVAQKIEGIIKDDEHPVARAWRGKVVRKIAKQPTMTMPYGAGQFGYRHQIMEALRKLEDETGKPHINADRFQAAGYLAGVMKDALGGVVVKAAQAMAWLQKASVVVSEDALPIRWEAPNGLPVVQDYREIIGERIDTEITGHRVQLMLTREGDKLDKRKQAQGIAPNFVHSLDASHMMETVCLALQHDITDFAMVHDSYGAHAGHADVLNRLLREAFVVMYREDVLGQFREQLVKQLSPKVAAKVPPLPEFGTLDPEAVMDSEYFFA